MQENGFVERIDIAYDLFDFVLVYQGESDKSREFKQFYVTLQQWTRNGMKMHINFDHPLYVSRGEIQDFIKMQIKEEVKELFIS